MLSYAMAPHNSRTISLGNTGNSKSNIMSSMETAPAPTYFSGTIVNHNSKTSIVSKLVLDSCKPKAKKKKTTATSKSKSKSRSEGEGRIHAVDFYVKNVNGNRPSLVKPNTDREIEKKEVEEERKAQVGKVLEVRDSKRKSRPLSIHQIRDKISNHDNQLHCDPLITMNYRFGKYQNKLVNYDTSKFDSNHSGSLDVIQEGEAYAEIGDCNHKQGLINEELSQLQTTSRQGRQAAFEGAGENEGLFRRSKACHSKAVSKTEVERKHDDELYHFNQVKITTKPKNTGVKRKSLTRTKFVSTEEFFRGTVFGDMFSSSINKAE